MARYIIVYLGGERPEDPDQATRHMEKYREWLASLGDAVFSALNPIKDTHTVHNEDKTIKAEEGSSIAMSGFTIIEANSLEAVIEMSKSCPFLDIGGKLEVSELMQMGGE